MTKDITKILITLTAFFLLNSLFAVKANAACASVPISGNYTVSASCAFANTVDGVDAGSGTSNTAVLTVNTGQTLTVNSAQTIGYGSITNNGTILLNTNKTAVLQKGPIWMTDQDVDGYVATTTQYAQSSAPANGRRRNLETNITTADCLDTDATKYQNLTGYTDADGDTYTTGGGGSVCSGASLPAGYRAAANGADCNDADATKYQNLTGYRDSDGDSATINSTASVCSGASFLAYNSSTNPYRSTLTSPVDCYDNNGNARSSQTSYFSTTRGTDASAINGGANDMAGNSGNSWDYDCNGAGNPLAQNVLSCTTVTLQSNKPSITCVALNPLKYYCATLVSSTTKACGSTVYPGISDNGAGPFYATTNCTGTDYKNGTSYVSYDAVVTGTVNKCR